MAIPTNAFTTYDAIGNREDLTDVITNISPTDTWFTSNSGNNKASARYHEWQIDTLATPTANAQIEANTRTATAITATTRTGNYVQTMSKDFMVSYTQDLVDKAGRASETAYQTQKKMKELALDIEYALLLNSASVSGDTGTARQLKGVLGWIATNLDSGTATGASTTLTATRITNVLQKVWSQGGKPQHILCGGFIKSAISSMTTSNTKYVDAPTKTVIDSVNVYDTDFGRIAIHLSHVLDGASATPSASNPGKANAIVFGDMNLWSKAWLAPVQKRELPVAAWAQFWSIQAQLTLECRQEAGSGAVQHNTVA
jgi:hypothetical protein